MGLRLIIGRSRSGKSSLCRDEISKKQKQGNRLIYIVPEQYSLQAERELVAASGGLIAATVLSFRRLSENIFSEKGGIAGKNIDDTGKLIILRRVLMKNKDRLNYFGVVCSRTGFINKLSDEISEFFSMGLTPENISEYAKNFSEGSSMALKLMDISLIYSEYCNFIKNEYITSDDMLTIAAEKMIDAKYISGAEVWLDGFYGFSHQELSIITCLLSSCSRVSITLNMDKKTAESKDISVENGFYEPWSTMQRLYKICADKGIKVEPAVFTQISYYSSEGMKRLEREYFGWNTNKTANSDGIKLFTADNAANEINMCASEIIHLVRDRGFRYRDIALTARVIKDYENEVKLTFSHYGIPFFMDSKRSVMGQPCTELIRSIVELTAEDMSYEAMFRCMKTELMAISRDERDILENYVLKYGIKGSTWTDERWKWGFEGYDTPDEENRINDIKERAIAEIRDFYKRFSSGKHTIKSITVSLYETLERLNLVQKLEERAETAEAMGDVEKSQEQIRCFELISGLMENMAILLGDDRVTAKEYGEILDAGLSGLKMGIIPAGIDAVIFGDIERTRLPDIKALFVVGANEGTLPSTVADTTGLFTEREKSVLLDSGIELSNSGARLAFEEQYQIYMGITKPSEYLYICRSYKDFTGRETRPSPIIGRLENIFPQIDREEFDSADIKSVDRPIPVLHRLGIGLAKESNVWKEAAQWLMNSEKYRNRALMINYGIKSQKEQNLSKDNLRKMYNGKMYTSVSRLETFSQCPFLFFSKYSLKAVPRAVYDIKTPDIGSMFHGVLEKFTLEMRERKYTWETIPEEEAREIIDETIDKLVIDTGSRVLLSKASYMYLIKRIKRITGRTVSVLKKHMASGSFTTLGSEIIFGDGELPAIEIIMPDGHELLLRGKIDRVDIYKKDNKGYIKIIDYKSGKKKFSLSDIYYGLQLQLLLYMDAFIKTGKVITQVEPQVGGAFYFRIMDPIIKASDLKGDDPELAVYRQFCMSGLACDEADVLEAFDEAVAYGEKSEIINVYRKKNGGISGAAVNREAYDSIMEYTVKKAGEIGGQIGEGNVSISPAVNGNSSPCDYCDYKAICCVGEDGNSEIRKLKHLSADEVWKRVMSDKKSDDTD